MRKRSDSCDNQSETGYGNTWHQGLESRKKTFRGTEKVKKGPNRNWKNGEQENVSEHSYGINGNNLVGRNLHEQRCHDGSQKRGCASHTYGKCHIAMTEKGHDVGGDSTGTAAYQEDANGKGWLQMKNVDKGICDDRHQKKLSAGTYKDVKRSLEKNLEVISRKCESHCQHDESQNHFLRIASNP